MYNPLTSDNSEGVFKSMIKTHVKALKGNPSDLKVKAFYISFYFKPFTSDKSVRKKEKALKMAIARERYHYLYKLAKEVFKEDEALSRRYGEIAIRLWLKFKFKRRKEEKVMFCRKCFTPWFSETVRVRAIPGEKRVVFKCRVCGWVKSFGYHKKPPKEFGS